MIGGTNSTGVPAHVFDLPEGHLMRYDVPTAALRPYISGYAVYGCIDRSPRTDMFLPAPPSICILADAGPVSVKMRYAEYRVPAVSLYGPSSEAFRVTTQGGINVGIGLTALGWMSLSDRPAASLRNRVCSLQEIAAAPLAENLAAIVADSACDDQIAPALDELLMSFFTGVEQHRSMLELLSDALLGHRYVKVSDVARRFQLSEQALRDLCKKVFGLCPKHVMDRSRFLRTYTTWKLSGSPQAEKLDLSSYHDTAHYLRDAQTYLATTPRRFNKKGILFLEAGLRARQAVLGAPAQALHLPN